MTVMSDSSTDTKYDSRRKRKNKKEGMKASNEGRLYSPGHGGDARIFADKTPLMRPVRGMRADPSVKLCALKNVGKARTDGVGLADTPYVRMAIRLLRTDPLRPDVVGRPVAEAPDSIRYAGHIVEMLDVGVLVIAPTEAEIRAWNPPLEHRDKTPMIARYGAVHKEWNDARGIFNLKYTNGMSTSESIPFKILGSKGFVRRLMHLDFVGRRYRIVHADCTNMYYQLATGNHLGLRCCVKCGNRIFMSKVLAMGLGRACGIAEAYTVGCICHRNAGQPSLGVPDEALSCNEVPGWIDLEDGGVIFVIYDSICIITEEKNAADWHQRLKTNFGDVNMLLKYNKLEGLDAVVPFCGMSLETCRSGLCWRLEKRQIDLWKDIARQRLVPSPRTLYKLVGFLRFAVPILGWRECVLGQLTRAQSELGLIDSWDEPRVHDSVIQDACELILAIDGDKTRHWKSHLKANLKRGRMKDMQYVAVDATPERWAMWPIDAQGNEIDIEKEEGTFDEPIHREFWIDGSKLVKIDYGEAFALRKGHDFGKRHAVKFLVVGNDNQGVGRSFVLGWSRSDAVNRQILEADFVRDATSETSMVMIVVDIHTDSNLADIGTRPHEPEKNTPAQFKKRRSDTIVRLRDGYREWILSGDEYNLRPKGVEEKVEECDLEPPSDDEREDPEEEE